MCVKWQKESVLSQYCSHKAVWCRWGSGENHEATVFYAYVGRRWSSHMQNEQWNQFSPVGVGVLTVEVVREPLWHALAWWKPFGMQRVGQVNAARLTTQQDALGSRPHRVFFFFSGLKKDVCQWKAGDTVVLLNCEWVTVDWRKVGGVRRLAHTTRQDVGQKNLQSTVNIGNDSHAYFL